MHNSDTDKPELAIIMAESIPGYACDVHPTPKYFELQLVEHADLYWESRGRRLRLQGQYFWVNQPRVHYEYGPYTLNHRWDHRFMVMGGRRATLWSGLGLLPECPVALPVGAMSELGGLLDKAIAGAADGSPVGRLLCANRIEFLLLKVQALANPPAGRPVWLDDCLSALDGATGASPNYNDY